MKIVVAITAAFLGFLALVNVFGNAQHSTASHSRQRAWNHKAVADVKQAARDVGGFTNEDVREYRNGLAHVRNQHERIGSFTVAQVVDEEKQRESARNENKKRLAEAQRQRAQLAQAKALEAQRRAQDAQRQAEEVAAAQRKADADPCSRADKLERQAADAANGDRYQEEYDLSVSGLNAVEECGGDTPFLNKGYLLSFKAEAEHHLGSGDWRTDMNQANALLVTCQTTPGMYGERTGAQCETQEHYNISSETDWDMQERQAHD